MSSKDFKMRIAVPSLGKGGLEDMCAYHFGKCKTFTMVDVVKGEVLRIEKVMNPDHETGNCLKVIGILKEKGVNAILVGGMGRMAFKVSSDLGIDVFYGVGEVKVIDAVQSYIMGELKPLTHDHLCKNGI